MLSFRNVQRLTLVQAVHDLSLHQPEIFVPAFTDLLPSVFACVIGSTLTLRVQACHALGGFAYAATTIPRDQIHTRISTAAADFFTDGLTSVPSASPEKKSPSKSASKDPLLIRALRTTLVATDPQHPAQGPVWALCVLANLIILIGPALYTSPRLERTIRAMLAVAMRTKRGSVRALLCLVSRCLTWVYFQPPLPPTTPSLIATPGCAVCAGSLLALLHSTVEVGDLALRGWRKGRAILPIRPGQRWPSYNLSA